MKGRSIFAVMMLCAGMALIGGCATKPQVVVMQEPAGQQRQVTVPKSTCTGAASGEQADALAREIVDANNNSMKEFDKLQGHLNKEDKRMAELQSTENKELQTANSRWQSSKSFPTSRAPDRSRSFSRQDLQNSTICRRSGSLRSSTTFPAPVTAER